LNRCGQLLTSNPQKFDGSKWSLMDFRVFTAQPFVDWCAEPGVATHYIQPGTPDQNA
jgi:hypothetical protein